MSKPNTEDKMSYTSIYGEDTLRCTGLEENHLDCNRSAYGSSPVKYPGAGWQFVQSEQTSSSANYTMLVQP